MKILHVRDVAHVATTLVEGLRALGHQAEVRQLKVAGGQYPLPIKALFLPQRLLEGAAVNRYIGRQGFQVVHIHFAYMGWLGIVGRYPYFLHCHGTDLRWNLRRPLLRWLTVRALRAARRVYCSTPDLLDEVAGVRPDAVFVPNPVNTDRFRPLPQAAGDRPRVLLISRLWDVKGPETAFAVARELRRRLPTAALDAFAWGPELGRYRGHPDVNLIPLVPYSEMPALINRYDAVVGQFSPLGAIGMSELESMACGVPVVSYFRYPHFYEEPPPLYSTNEVTKAVDQLVALLEDPALRRQLGEAGREWVLRYHSYLQVARLLEAEYAAAGEPRH